MLLAIPRGGSNRSLLGVLRQQASAGFTGNIILQGAENGQFLGRIVLEGGNALEMEVEGVRGSRALPALVVLFEEERGWLVVEPEQITISSRCSVMGRVPIEEIIKQITAYSRLYRRAQNHRPAGHLRLQVAVHWHERWGRKLLPYFEVDLLEVLSHYSLVSDIYQNAPLREFEVTMGLVRLRERGALKVVGSE